MIPRINANDTSVIYTATQQEIDDMKKKYPWYYKVTAGSQEIMLCIRVDTTVTTA